MVYYNPRITGQYNPLYINLFKDLQDLKRDESGVAPSQWQMKVYKEIPTKKGIFPVVTVTGRGVTPKG